MLYKDFSARMAKASEDEANLYANHPDLQDADQQYIRALRETCRHWKRQIEKLEAAHRPRAS